MTNFFNYDLQFHKEVPTLKASENIYIFQVRLILLRVQK